MKKFKIIKNGIETNSWVETPEMGSDYWEPSFGKKAYDEIVKDSEGNIVEVISHPAEYSVVEEEFDPLALHKKSEALTYLASTDWYVVRKAETGKEIPQEIVEKRAEARLQLA